MISEIFTSNSSQTKKVGRLLAQEILKTGPAGQAIIIGLVGDLGGGKTTFLQGFAQELGVKDRILSPTFIIMRRTGNFYHLDCYRIKNPKEISALGFKKLLADPKNIIAVEWADRIQGLLPKNAIIVRFKITGKNTRKISITAP